MIFALTIFLFEVLVCWVSFIEKINKQNETVLWSSPRSPKLMFVNICLCLFTFYLCNFMRNNAHLLLLACAFVSSFDYYSVYGSFNKGFLINLPKSWFIPCFHFLLPMSEVCRFSLVVIFRLWYQAALYTAQNDWKVTNFHLYSFTRGITRSKSQCHEVWCALAL